MTESLLKGSFPPTMRRNRNVVTTYSSSDDDGSDSSEDAKSDWVSVQLSELSSMQFSDFGHDGYYSDSFLEECEAETGMDDYESYMAGHLDIRQRIAADGVIIPVAFAAALQAAASPTITSNPASGDATPAPEEEEEVVRRKKELRSLVMRGHLKVVKRPDTYASTMRHPDVTHPHGHSDEPENEKADDSLPSDRRVGVKSKREENDGGAAGEGRETDAADGTDKAVALTNAADDKSGAFTPVQNRRRSLQVNGEGCDYESTDHTPSSTSGQSGASSKKSRRSRIDAQAVDMDEVSHVPHGKPPLVNNMQPRHSLDNNESRLPYNPRQTLTVVRGLYNTNGIGGGMGPSATPKLSSSMATSRGSTVTTYRTPVVVRRDLHILTADTPLTHDNLHLDALHSSAGSTIPDSDSHPFSGGADVSDANISHLSDIRSGNSPQQGDINTGEGRTTGHTGGSTPLLQQPASHSLTASSVKIYHAFSQDESELSDAGSTLSQSARLTTTVEVTVHASNIAHPSEMFSEMRPPSRRYSMQPRQKRNSSMVTSTVNDFMRLLNRVNGNQASPVNPSKPGKEGKTQDDRSGVPPRRTSRNRGRRDVHPTTTAMEDSVDESPEDDDPDEMSEDYGKDDLIEAMDMPPKPSTSSPHPPPGSRSEPGNGSHTAATKASNRRRVSARPFLEDTMKSNSSGVSGEILTAKNSHNSIGNRDGAGSSSSDPLQTPLDSTTYRANTYRRTSKGSVEATIVEDDDGNVPTVTSPISPSKGRSSLQGESTSKRVSQPYRLPAVKYLSGGTGTNGSGQLHSNSNRKISKSLSPRGSIHTEDKGNQVKETSSSDTFQRLSERAASGGPAGGSQSRYNSLSKNNRTSVTPQDMDRNASLSSLPLKGGRLTPIASQSPFDEGIGAQKKNSTHGLRTEEALAYPRFSMTGSSEPVNVKLAETSRYSLSHKSSSAVSRDLHSEQGVARRTTLRPVNTGDSSESTSRSNESSRSGTTTTTTRTSRILGQTPPESKQKGTAQTKEKEQSKSKLQPPLATKSEGRPKPVPVSSLPQLMPLQENADRKSRNVGNTQETLTTSQAKTNSPSCVNQPSAAVPNTLQGESTAGKEMQGHSLTRKVSSTVRIVRRTSSHRQQPLISDVKFGGSRDDATPSPTADISTANTAEKEQKVPEFVKQGGKNSRKEEEENKKPVSEATTKERLKKGDSVSPISPSPRSDGISFPKTLFPDGGAEERDSPQTVSASQRGVWPDCAPPVAGSYDYGGPTVDGAATPMLPDGMLFMVISPTNEYAFYNDTLTHTFYVTFKFTSRTTPAPERHISSNAKVSSVRTQSSREVRQSEQELFSEVKPGDTVILYTGQLLNPKVEVSFSTVQRNYVPRPVAENGSMISAAIARIKSKMGSWNKRVSEESLVRCCVKNRVPFIDIHFRPSHRSLCRVGFDEVYIPPLLWMTPQQFLPECFKSNGLKSKPVRRLFPAQDVGLSLDGACKGSIDDGGLIGAIVASAEYVDHVHWMFRHPKTVEKGKAERRVGVYRVVLCVNGWWSTYIIDEYLPASRRGPLFAYFGPDFQCQWVSLMEKAYAKALGSYAQICFGDFDEHLRDVFGYPVRSITPVIQKEVKLLHERAEQDGKDTHDAHSDLFSYLGQCTRRNLLCVLFTPYSYTPEEDDDLGGASTTEDTTSASSSITRRSTGPWQSRGSITERSPSQPYWMRGSVSTEAVPTSISPARRSRQSSQIPSNAVLIEVQSAVLEPSVQETVRTPVRSGQKGANASDIVFGSKETPIDSADAGEMRPSTTTSSHTRASGDTDTADKMPRMERPRNRTRSQLQQSSQLMIGDSSEVEEGTTKGNETNQTSNRVENKRRVTGEKGEGVRFTAIVDDHGGRDKGKNTDGGSPSSPERNTLSPNSKSHVGGLGYGSRLTQRREWSDEELQRIFPPDHPFIVKATLFSRELKQRMVGIKNPWKANNRIANATGPDTTAAMNEDGIASSGASSPSAATSPGRAGRDAAQVPVVDVGSSPSAGTGGMRRTLSVGPKSGGGNSRFTQSFASMSMVRNGDIGGQPPTEDGAGQNAFGSFSSSTGASTGIGGDRSSSSTGKQQDGEDDLIWIPWSSALRLFCGGSVTYCLKNWCQYRVYGEFENGCSSLVLRLDVRCSVDVMMTLYQEDLRLITTDSDAKGAAGKGTRGRSHRVNETAMRMVERRAGYLPILLAMSAASTTTPSATAKKGVGSTSSRSTTQHVVAKSTDDLEAPSLGPHGSGGGAEMQHLTPTGKDAWMFLKERTVTLKMTLVPESSPYYLIPHIHEEIAYDRCRPFSIELLSDQAINTLDSKKREGSPNSVSASQKGSNVQCRFLSVPHTNPCFTLASSFDIRVPEDDSSGTDGKTTAFTGPVDASSKRKSHGVISAIPEDIDPALAKPIETSYQVKTFKGFDEKEGDAIVDANACASA